MARKETVTDLWVSKLLEEARIPFYPQGSNIKEIATALKTASKSGTGKSGFPEYTAVIKDFLLVIEDKADIAKHEKKTKNNTLADDKDAVVNYAVNGAIFYGKHLATHTNYKKILSIGISGDEKRHKISPFFIDERGYHTKLPEIETLISFNEQNIDEYYIKEILKERTDFEKTTAEILREAQSLHEDLRNYGSIQDKDKPLVVSGILLALREIEYRNFDINNLIGDKKKTDGQKIYNAIKDNLARANVSPEVKKDKLLTQFAVIKDTAKINEVNVGLGKTPLKHYTEFLYKSIYQNIRYNTSAEDFLGRFYGEFTSYSGGDGQALGIILTPRHITELFCNLADLKPNDKVFDPCCGTAGFLIAAMHNMLLKAKTLDEKNDIKKKQLFGIEIQSYMFTIATTNMILRGDGKSNLYNKDFLNENPFDLQKEGYTVGMMNPPYSQGSKQNPDLYEIAFTEHLLNSVTEGGKVIVIVPQSSMTGKTTEEKNIKTNILKKHTLEGVITLNKNTFYGVGTNPCIAIFTAHIPHSENKVCKFINFEDDGYEVAKHIGLVDNGSAKDKKQHLLDVWFDRTDAPTKFCVKTTIEPDDEWLHSFYYFNDEIPSEEDFRNTIADYLTFEVNMITHGRGYLFGFDDEKVKEQYPKYKNHLSLKVAKEDGDYSE
ncbi:HsdM family class I SAM-dependent methyltransferase [Treponema phagedenis]|uniref:site-specific DNA-methyltransferase (adenine-specific) n=1 Tax=Treponema phagedenis TaxID=162 RepID=A0AAE6M8B1_TREPH|nr:N-6 DNA methylase [Treponema phagedenis]QEJ98174.1 N-6 DNA methylase [Treponema phagedenis]QEJ99966.1 N-6 DNA methylase [Treponema phagedenis]QEK03681.1 N-6 DNA methylase [Treponema phagedenis]QEK09298.1 N-6 DNA methylase [Treponema phagedenis]